MKIGNPKKLLDDCYILPCNETLDIFCSHHWQCSFRNRRGRCVNTQSGHIKGHQNSSASVIATGKYHSKFNYEGYEQKWRQALRRNLVEIHQKVLERTISSQRDEKTSASIVHLELIKQLLFYPWLCGDIQKPFRVLRLFRRISGIPAALWSCLMCNMHRFLQPDSVIRANSSRKLSTTSERNKVAGSVADQSEAPSGWVADFDTRRVKISSREFLFYYKHSFDTANRCRRGGMRGIAELEVLKAIQNHLPRIPIHEFFDLIVGTMYGTKSLGPIC